MDKEVTKLEWSSPVLVCFDEQDVKAYKDCDGEEDQINPEDVNDEDDWEKNGGPKYGNGNDLCV